jgi:DNA mismatch endonuclease (patch repair protein)
MSRIKGKNTKPEETVRKLLWHNGYRYRIHYKKLPGKPDIVFAGRKKVIFVNGCFWHRHNCRYFQWPKTREEFWRKKIGDTVKRDQRNYRDLFSLGWEYLVIWECEIRNLSELELVEKAVRFLDD